MAGQQEQHDLNKIGSLEDAIRADERRRVWREIGEAAEQTEDACDFVRWLIEEARTKGK